MLVSDIKIDYFTSDTIQAHLDRHYTSTICSVRSDRGHMSLTNLHPTMIQWHSDNAFKIASSLCTTHIGDRTCICHFSSNLLKSILDIYLVNPSNIWIWYPLNLTPICKPLDPSWRKSRKPFPLCCKIRTFRWCPFGQPFREWWTLADCISSNRNDYQIIWRRFWTVPITVLYTLVLVSGELNQ